MNRSLPQSAESFNSIHYFPSLVQIGENIRTPLNKPFLVPGLIEQLRESRETLFINPTLSQGIELNERLLRSTNFIKHPEWSVGRDDSSQGIFFGEYNLVVDKGSNGVSFNYPVAVKPYHETKAETDPWESAIHEYIGCLLLNKTGSIRTFDPIGIWVDEEKKPFLLTHFEEEVISLDNFSLLEVSSSDNNKEESPTIYPLQYTADVLAMLHSNGFSHGDAQIKNFASDRLQGLVCDLVRLRRIVAPEEVIPDANAIRSHIANDLKMLIGSVIEQAYMPPESIVNMRQTIDTNLVQPYVKKMKNQISSPIHALCCDGSIELEIITTGLLDQI